MTNNPTIILHWYSLSPFAQKVRWALNFKKVEYKLVEIPILEPRPERRPIDGGYRKTPILQIGNHTFCDSKAIFAELERRFPEPSFYPAGPQNEPTEAKVKSLARWLDSTFFMTVGSQVPVDVLDDAFLKDRQEFSGRPFERQKLKFTAPYMRHSLKSEFELLQTIFAERSESGKRWALGTDQLSLLDLHVAMNTWFMSALIGSEWIQKEFPLLAGHLQKTLTAISFEDADSKDKLVPEEAIEIAKKEKIELVESKHDGSLPIELGELVAVIPTDMGVIPSTGKLVYSTTSETVIEHQDETHKSIVYIHFPVNGFVVIPLQNKL
ncbi:hypothetical protein G6F37_001620 [Rhizopus arrhizus]|nr:hypothetical protein G6F38_000984 [Rhizopus arrhizus]KAG1163000.1 hypothetical protein G6F37_001620 [Rhizopus arrhizus]